MFPPPPLCGLLQTQRHRETPAEGRSPPVPRAAGRLGHRAVQVRRARRWYGGQALRQPPPPSSSQLRPTPPCLRPSGSRNAPRQHDCGSPHLQHLSLSLAPMHAEPGSSVWPPHSGRWARRLRHGPDAIPLRYDMSCKTCLLKI